MSVTAVPLRPIAKGSLTKLWAGIALLAAVGAGVAYASTRGAVMAALSPAEYMAGNANGAGVVTLPSGLQYKVLKAGEGPKPGPADMTVVNYEGKLARTGETFDASERHGGPATLPVSGLIPGWSEGIQQMPQGSKYRLWIPPELGYGAQGAGPNGEIPGDSVLIFDIELLAVQKGAMPMGMPGMGEGHGGVVPPPM